MAASSAGLRRCNGCTFKNPDLRRSAVPVLGGRDWPAGVVAVDELPDEGDRVWPVPMAGVGLTVRGTLMLWPPETARTCPDVLTGVGVVRFNEGALVGAFRFKETESVGICNCGVGGICCWPTG